jgi:hypothetical protein
MNSFRILAAFALCSVSMIPVMPLASDTGSIQKGGGTDVTIAPIDANSNPLPDATIKSESGYDYSKPIEKPKSIEPLGVQPAGTQERNNRVTPRSFGSSKPSIGSAGKTSIGSAGKTSISSSGKPGSYSQNKKIISTSDFKNKQRTAEQQQPATEQ